MIFAELVLAALTSLSSAAPGVRPGGLKPYLRAGANWAMSLTPTHYFDVQKSPSAEPNLVLIDWGRPGWLFE